jgi:hypothetical protein
MFFQGSSTKVPVEYINYNLCKTFGWTYEQLLEQPSDFIEKMIDIIKIENKFKNGRRN